MKLKKITQFIYHNKDIKEKTWKYHQQKRSILGG